MPGPAVSVSPQGCPGLSSRRVVCDKAEGLLDEFLPVPAELMLLGEDDMRVSVA
jgi:hypothetical protein